MADAIAALLDELLSLAPADRRAIEALLSPDERARLRTAERVLREPASREATFDLSPYSGWLSKVLLPVLHDGARTPSKLAPATQDAIRAYFQRSART